MYFFQQKMYFVITSQYLSPLCKIISREIQKESILVNNLKYQESNTFSQCGIGEFFYRFRFHSLENVPLPFLLFFFKSKPPLLLLPILLKVPLVLLVLLQNQNNGFRGSHGLSKVDQFMNNLAKNDATTIPQGILQKRKKLK